MKPYIELKKVKKRYDQLVAFQAENLTIEKQQVCALIGKNGSGKSTLLKLISGLIYPEEGEVTVSGVATTKKNIKSEAKFVLESGRGYYDYLTAHQNLTYFLQLNHTNEKVKKQELEELTKQFDFSGHWDKLVSDLSQGNRQKLSLIITLLLQPKILCLDEPTNGLDLQSKDQLIACLKSYTKQGMTVLFTTHDLYFTEKMANRLLLIHEGKILRDENPKELLEKADQVTYQITVTKDSYEQEKEWVKGNVEVSNHRVVVTTTEKVEKEQLLQKADVLDLETKHITMEEVLNEVLTHVG